MSGREIGIVAEQDGIVLLENAERCECAPRFRGGFVDILDAGLAPVPEPFRDRRHTAPEANVEQLVGDKLGPQARFAAEDAPARPLRKVRVLAEARHPRQALPDMREPRMIGDGLLVGVGGGSRVEGEVHVRRVEQIQVVRGADDAVVAGAERGVAGFDSAPSLDRGVLPKSLVQTLVPADGAFAQSAERVDDMLVERRAIPPDFVAAEVNELVWEHVGQLAKERVDGTANFDVLDVQADVVYAESRTRSLDSAVAIDAPIRVCRQPARGVTGDVDLRHDANGPVGSVVDKIAEFGGRIGLDTREFRVARGAEAKSLVVSEVQVQDVQLVERHHVECASERIQRDEMPNRIDHHGAPGVARRIANLRDLELSLGDKLRQGRECRECSPFGRSLHPNGLAQRQPVCVQVGELGNRLCAAPDFEFHGQPPRRQPGHGPPQTFGTRALDRIGPRRQHPVWAGLNLPRVGQQTYRHKRPRLWDAGVRQIRRGDPNAPVRARGRP